MRSVTFGPYRLELEIGELFRSDALVKLHHQPAKLLVMLVERGRRIMLGSASHARSFSGDGLRSPQGHA